MQSNKEIQTKILEDDCDIDGFCYTVTSAYSLIFFVKPILNSIFWHPKNKEYFRNSMQGVIVKYDFAW